jgi:hypothetical protein
MNTMTMPRFTAEDALYKNINSYLAGVHISNSQQVMPQVISWGCFVRSALRTYNRCIGLGYGSEICAQTAVDLAASVCDF